jgi:beta-phosphoglucomutase-like phosphatase (HAD superfamily)
MAKLKELGASINPASCIAIEDSHWGLEAAHKAGLRCVAVTNTYAAGELCLADLIVERLADLTLATVERLIRN